MDIKMGMSAYTILRQLFDMSSSTEAHIETKPQKPAFTDMPRIRPLPRCRPEETGVSSRQIADFLDDLKSDVNLDIHSVMVLRGNMVLAEADFGAYDHRLWHIMFSASKSVTGLAVGMLVDDGSLKLDDKLIDLLEIPNALNRLTHKNITLKNLLTMTSGVVFNEAGSVTEEDWVKCFMESNVIFPPGKKFNYNSMNTYMLSYIVKKISGKSMMDFLTERLWEPLGIDNVFWETCPMGTEKGGWGLYICPEDMAKVGVLVMQGGNYEGHQLISEKWIREAVTTKVVTPDYTGGFNYGYQIWTGRNRNTFLFNGMFGQNLWGNLDNGIIVMCTAGNNVVFQRSSYFDLLEKHFTSEVPAMLPLDNPGYGRLLAEKGLMLSSEAAGESRDIEPKWRPPRHSRIDLRWTLTLCKMLDGRHFLTEGAGTTAVGLYPLIMQVIQNNYTKGIKGLLFEYKEEHLFLTIEEEDERHVLPIGFLAPSYTELSFHGEKQRVGVKGWFTTNEDDVPVLKLRVSFLELASSRLIKVFFYGNRIHVRFSENPGIEYVSNGTQMVKEMSKANPLVRGILTEKSENIFKKRIRRVFEPSFRAYLE